MQLENLLEKLLLQSPSPAFICTYDLLLSIFVSYFRMFLPNDVPGYILIMSCFVCFINNTKAQATKTWCLKSNH